MQSKFRVALLLVGLAAAGGVTATIAQGDDPPSTAAFRTVDGSNQFQRTAGSGKRLQTERRSGAQLSTE